jgi:hypothetical protein
MSVETEEISFPFSSTRLAFTAAIFPETFSRSKLKSYCSP